MKKMRRMIPALCMLLVSAIMLTTASYAWFTMSNEATATGMQVQAQSSGALVIGLAPLKDTDKKSTSVTLDSTIRELKPVTWVPADVATTLAGEGATAGWYTGVNANYVTGAATLEKIDDATDMTGTYFEEEFYLGSAGDTILNQTIQLNLAALIHVEGDIAYNAYAAAIYVYEQGDSKWDLGQLPGTLDAPAKVIHVADWNASLSQVILEKTVTEEVEEDGDMVTKTTTSGYDIPSVVGLTTNTTGLKVVVRVFVDGNLKNEDTNGVIQVDTYVEDYVQANDTTKKVINAAGEQVTVASVYGTFNEKYQYFEKKETTTGDVTAITYEPCAQTQFNESTDVTGYYVLVTYVGDKADQYCINSNNVPTDAATLKFTFKIAEYVAPAPEQDETQG